MSKNTGSGEKTGDRWTGAEKWVWIPAADSSYEPARVLSEDAAHLEVEAPGGIRKLPQSHAQKMNPRKFDLVCDMAHLSCLNEPSILHNLRERYLAGFPYTYSGLFLVAVNPYRALSIYRMEDIEQYSSKYKRDEAPPHIYAVASEAYSLMRTTGTPQTILITGESGAGKTENTKHAIKFLTRVSNDTASSKYGSNKLDEKLLWANPLLEAFGNARTLRNDNSSRFGKFVRIEFGMNGEIIGASIERYLLEAARVTRQNEGENNYHVFYTLMEDAPEEVLGQLHLGPVPYKEHRIVSPRSNKRSSSMDPSNYSELSSGGDVGSGESVSYKGLCKAMEILGFAAEDQMRIFRILSAIIHLGDFEFEEASSSTGSNARLSPESMQSAEWASELLGVEARLLLDTLLRPRIKAGHEVVAHGRTALEAQFTTGALCRILYERVFDWIVLKVNEALRPKAKPVSYIGVLDIAGFEILGTNGFEQLCINFTNEKLQQFFNHRMFVIEQETYIREGLSWDMIDFGLDLQPTIDLLEKNPGGVFSLLDEECVVPGGSDDRLLEKVTREWGGHGKFSIGRFNDGFRIEHYAGSVKYSESGWILKNKDPLDEAVASLLLGPKGPVPYGKGDTRTKLSANRFRTVSQRHREQLSELIDLLGTTNPHFVRCIVPNAAKKAGELDSLGVLLQLRCNGVLEGVRISRQGFPTRIKFRDFLLRYSLLAEDRSVCNSLARARTGPTDGEEMKMRARSLLKSLGVGETQFRIGRSLLFLRQGVLADLEEHRDLKVSGAISKLQARLRSILKSRLAKKESEKESASRTIQRNARIFAEVRQWGWWKLCMKVRPLLEVRRAEDEIRERDLIIAGLRSEIEAMKSRFEREAAEGAILLDHAQRIQVESEMKCRGLEVELDRAKSECLEATRELLSAKKRLEAAKGEVAGMNMKLEQTKEELKNTRNEIITITAAQLNEQLHKAEEEASKLRGSLEATRSELSSARSQTVGLSTECVAVKEERDLLAARMATMRAEAEDLQSALQASDAERYKCEVKIRTMEDENRSTQEALAFEREKGAKLEEAFKRARASLESTVREAQPAVSSNSAEILRLRDELRETRESLVQAREECAEMKRQYLDVLDGKLGEIFEREDDVKVENGKLRSLNIKIKSELEEKKSEILDLERTRSEVAQDLKREVALRKKLEVALECKGKEVWDLARTASAMKSELDDAKSELAHGVVEANEEFRRKLKLKEEVLGEMDNSAGLVAALVGSIDGLGEMVSTVTGSVKIFLHELGQLGEELARAACERDQSLAEAIKLRARVGECESLIARANKEAEEAYAEKRSVLEEMEVELKRQRDGFEKEIAKADASRRSLERDAESAVRHLREKERELGRLSKVSGELQAAREEVLALKEKANFAEMDRARTTSSERDKYAQISKEISSLKSEAEKGVRERRALCEEKARAERALEECKEEAARERESALLKDVEWRAALKRQRELEAESRAAAIQIKVLQEENSEFSRLVTASRPLH